MTPLHPCSLLLTAACLAMLPSGAGAQSSSPADAPLRLSGFGTVAAARITAGDVAYSQPTRRDGVQGGWNPKLDSKLALQARLRVHADLSATAQVIARHRAEGDFGPELEWAFLRWDAGPALSLRIGRMGAPYFMSSDSREVNYTHLTARPPLEVYGQVPTRQFDGVDAAWRAELDQVSVQASLWAGRSEARYVASGASTPIRGRYVLDHQAGLNLTAALDNGLTLRAGVAAALITADLGQDSPPGGWPAPVQQTLDRALGTKDDDAAFGGLGVSYDQGRWLVNAEVTRRRSNTPLPDTTAWYLNAGYRWGDFIPYAGVSRVKVDRLNRPNPFAAHLGQPSLLGSLADGVQPAVDGLIVTQRAFTLGTRWDVWPQAAIKLQWDRITKPRGSYGHFDVPGGNGSSAGRAFFRARREIDLLSVSVDFVF